MAIDDLKKIIKEDMERQQTVWVYASNEIVLMEFKKILEK